MKHFLSILSTLLIFAVCQAQEQFEATNSDGKTLYCQVTDASAHHAALRSVTNGYSGSIIVPEQVDYQGEQYTITCVNALAFQNCNNLKYVSLPSTITEVKNNAFRQVPRLDSIRFHSTSVPTISSNALRTDQSVDIHVACGLLSAFRRAMNGTNANLVSDCSVMINVTSSFPSPFITTTGVGYYEVGDTALLHTLASEGYYFFEGWRDNGSDNPYRTEIVTGEATFEAVWDTLPMEYLNANTVSALTTSLGGIVKYYVPNNLTQTIYRSHLWLGGLTDLQVQHGIMGTTTNASGETIRLDTIHGIYSTYGICGQMGSTIANTEHRIWKLTRAEIDQHINGVGTPGYRASETILTWPGNNSNMEPLAPYYDADGDGIYNPYCGDYPIIRGDMAVFTIYNDSKNYESLVSNHQPDKCLPMGAEVHCMFYSFDEPEDSALNSTVYANYTIYNRSNDTYHNAYLGLFTDFDLGFGFDDFIGCDVSRGCSYAYNGDEVDGPGDGAFGERWPSQTAVILAGARLTPDGLDNPKIDIEKMRLHFPDQLSEYEVSPGVYDTVALTNDAKRFYPTAWYFSPDDSIGNNAINGYGFGNGIADDERLGMTNFTYYVNSNSPLHGDPREGTDYYNYMSGHWKNGQPITFGDNGFQGTLPCKFMLPGDSDPLHWGTNGIVPDDFPDNWVEMTSANSPGDRRGIASSGPFTFEANSVQEFDVAFVTGDYLGDMGALASALNYTDRAREAFVRDTTPSGKPFTYRPYSAPHVGINAIANSNLTLYPNPTNNYVRIEMPGTQSLTVEVFNIQGQRVMRHRSSTDAMILDLRNLPSGMYIIRAGGCTQRLIKK